MAEMKASIAVTLIDKVTGPAHRVNQSLSGVASVSERFNRLKASSLAVGNGIAKVSGEAAALGGKLLLLGGAGAWFFKSQFIDTAAQFERFTAILETIEGSSSKASQAMEWVSDFAAKTPYELGEVTDAFVKLRSYGIDPMNGVLLALGDASSAMGKPLMQSVEAIADAMTGEYERLKEFGIRGDVKGNKVRFSYTDKDGNTQYKVVNNKDREAIRLALQAVWAERYAGAMEKRSKGWEGMLSNLFDQLERFKLLVMKAGVFDYLKEKLKGLLDTLDRMAANGELKALAEEIGGNLKTGLKQAWQAAQGLWTVLKGLGAVATWVADKVGGFEVLGAALGVAIGGKLLLSIASLIGSLWSLGAAAAGVASSVAGVAAATSVGVATMTKLAAIAPVLLNAAGGVTVAAGTGYAIGTGVNAGINYIDKEYGTQIGHAIGEGVAKALAFFGVDEARRAVSGDYSYPSQTPAEMTIRVESVGGAKVKSVSTTGIVADVKMGRRTP